MDGKETPILEANLAFKAVRVDSGEHTVRLVYDGGWMGKAGLAIAFLGLGFALWIMLALAREFIR